LSSSLSVALGVRAAQLKNKKLQEFFIGITICCAFGFLVVKYFEYSAKFEHHLVPGVHFEYGGHGSHGAADTPHLMSGAITHSQEAAGSQTMAAPVRPTAPLEAQGQQQAQRAEMFFSLYFIMTGLHGLHVIIGILGAGNALVYDPLRLQAVEGLSSRRVGGTLLALCRCCLDFPLSLAVSHSARPVEVL